MIEDFADSILSQWRFVWNVWIAPSLKFEAKHVAFWSTVSLMVPFLSAR